MNILWHLVQVLPARNTVVVLPSDAPSLDAIVLAILDTSAESVFCVMAEQLVVHTAGSVEAAIPLLELC